MKRRADVALSTWTGSKGFCVDRCRSCSNPSSTKLHLRLSTSPASWLSEDVWLAIMEHLGPKSLMHLGLVCRAFYRLVMIENSRLWRIACHRELNVPFDASPKFSWRQLFASAVDGSHAYTLRGSDQHIDWLRVGSFQIQSGEVLVVGDLIRLVAFLNCASEENTGGNNDANTLTKLSNVQTGSWIADLHLVKCDFCEQQECNGTMQVFDARYWELFLHDEYKAGVWNFEELEDYIVPHPFKTASVGILDAQRLNCKSTKEILKLKSWIHPASMVYPATAVNTFAAAANTNVIDNEITNEGLLVKVYRMKAGSTGPVVAIRITQCLAPGTADPYDNDDGNNEEEVQ